MYLNFFISLFIFCCLASSPITAQTTVEFPYSGLVFQRNNSGEGQVLVSGFSTTDTDDIQVRLVPYSAGTGTATAWQSCVIHKTTDQTIFQLIIPASQGWYNLSFKILRAGRLVETKLVRKVGVGEVFVIAGQSNAQGQPNNLQKKASDIHKRVNIVLGYEPNLEGPPSYDLYELESWFTIYPLGQGAWCWGELGDLLTARLNVPVLLFNAATANTSSVDWAKSIDNLATVDPTRAEVPYYALKRTLQFYVNIVGCRAILWHQGERDTFLNPPSDYFKNISRVIEETRRQTGQVLPWVVSRASYALGQTRPQTLADQQRLANELPMVFNGPYTDTIKNARLDNLHFTNANNLMGLTKLASAWNGALSQDFFAKSVPLLPDFSKNTYVLKDESIRLPTGYSQKNWGVNYQSLSFVTDAKQNYYLSVLEPCKEARSLYSTEDDILFGSRMINENNKLTSAAKAKNSTLILNAKKSLIVTPGFEAPTGSTFTAEIAGCNN